MNRYLLLIVEDDEILLYDKKYDAEVRIPYSEVDLYIYQNILTEEDSFVE